MAWCLGCVFLLWVPKNSVPGLRRLGTLCTQIRSLTRSFSSHLPSPPHRHPASGPFLLLAQGPARPSANIRHTALPDPILAMYSFLWITRCHPRRSSGTILPSLVSCLSLLFPGFLQKLPFARRDLRGVLLFSSFLALFSFFPDLSMILMLGRVVANVPLVDSPAFLLCVMLSFGRETHRMMEWLMVCDFCLSSLAGVI